MKNLKRLNGKQMLCWIGLAVLFIGLSGSTCTEERSVQVVVTADILYPLTATGSDNTYSGQSTVSLQSEIDLDEILEENDLESIDQVTVQAAFYRVTRPDAVASRTITGSVSVCQGTSCTPQTLITYQSVLVADPDLADWTAVPLEAAGVAVLNSALEQLRSGGSVLVTASTTGTSTPIDQATSFDYEVMVRLNVVGTALVEVIEPI